MADGGEMTVPSSTTADAHGDNVAQAPQKASIDHSVPLEQIESILRSRANTPNPFSRQHTSLDLDDYFVSWTRPLTALNSLYTRGLLT